MLLAADGPVLPLGGCWRLLDHAGEAACQCLAVRLLVTLGFGSLVCVWASVAGFPSTAVLIRHWERAGRPGSKDEDAQKKDAPAATTQA